MQKSAEQDKRLFIDIEKMSLPKGGGAYKGLSESFNVNLFTGEGTVSVPVYASPCRGYEPKLNLNYSTSSGNGVFGLGFSMGLPFVTRKTAEHTPKYCDELDKFIINMSLGGELIPNNEYKSEEGFVVNSYNLRNEREFSKIESFKKESIRYWKVTDRNNTVTVFGSSPYSRIADPADPLKVFSWLISESIDDKGNKTEYFYNEGNLIKTIRYGNYYSDKGEEEWGFSVQFQYNDNREDCFCNYGSGFLIETKVLCESVRMYHHFEDKQSLVRETKFTYAGEGENKVSLLSKVSVTGYCENKEGIAETLQTPDVCFSYTQFAPLTGNFYIPETENKNPFVLDKRGFSLVDLYGEGISGLLYTSEETSLYCRPLGNYRYESPQSLEEFPIHKIHKDFSKSEYSLMSLEANGKYELVVKSPSVSGYYELTGGKWSQFETFKTVAAEGFSAYCEIADLQGDKLNHQMIAERGNLRYYPSLKKEGAGQPVTVKLPEDFPEITKNSPTEVVTFLDIFGDGLTHRVRITNGSVECWPNLGYGKFGEKVMIENAPSWTEGFDASRLFFADIDGLGAVDFIYAYSDRVDIYFNQCGRYFQKPISIYLPEAFSKEDSILFGDINGAGTNCMVFSKLGYKPRHYCFDFTGGKKPYMLRKIDNNIGVCTELQYKSSVELYLNDRDNNILWKQKPPFPVQLIVGKTIRDEISGNVHITKYRYKDGLYDFQERRFIGFGFIDQQEYIENAVYRTDTIRTKNWYYIDSDSTDEYFGGDKDALKMKDHIFKCTNLLGAKKALYGSQLREEVYEYNSDVPSTVKQNNYTVDELVAPDKKNCGSYLAQALESIYYTYEKDAADPVVRHEFVIEVDSYYNVLRKAAVSYPRRKCFEDGEEIAKQQAVLHIAAGVYKYINATENARYIGVLAEEKEFEIRGGLRDKYFSQDSIKRELEAAFGNEALYGEEFTDTKTQARLVEWRRHFYWDKKMTTALPLGEIDGGLLIHHIEETVFPEKFPILNNRFEDRLLDEDCGYIRKEGYWWHCHLIRYYYGEKNFYLPWKEELPGREKSLKTKTSIAYDKYCLMPIEIAQYVAEGVENVSSASIDYTALDYKQIKDTNDNVSQVIFDPLGQVIVTTLYGISDGKPEGNADIREYVIEKAERKDVLCSPEKYLQNITSYFYYDLLSYQTRKQPVHSILLQRQDFCSDNPDSAINCGIVYWDGFGRKAEEKKRINSDSWIVKNRTVYNSYGKEIMVYPSFYADNPEYEYKDISMPPVIRYYDYLQRVTEIKKPRGGIAGEKHGYLHSRTEYYAWEQRYFDENSCMGESDYYKKFTKSFPENPTIEQSDRKSALEKSLVFDGKMKRTVFDGLGNKIAEMPEAGEFVQYYFDIKKNIIKIADARIRKTGKYNLQYIYNMQGGVVYTYSCDAGEKLTLNNIFGKTVHVIDANGVHKKIIYDALARPLEISVDNIGIVERIEYGETAAMCKDKNLKGQIYRHYDQAGVETNHVYNIMYNVKEKSRRFCKQYKKAVDWSDNIELEEEIAESFIYNMSGRITKHTTPDYAEYRYIYDCFGQLKKVISANDNGSNPLVEDIRYNAEGQRAYILYGNGAATNYCINDITFQLENITSTGASGGNLSSIQNLSYIYDPVGNLVRVRDNSGKTVYNNQQVTEPIWDYTYDQYYRLQRATGRESAGDKSDFENIVKYTQDYLYDMGGNMTQLRHISASKCFTAKMGISDDSNRMKTTNNPVNRDGVCENIEYDACGNIINLSNIRKMKWNYENQLVHAVVIDRAERQNDEEYYLYDYSGNRVRKVTVRKINDDKVEVTDKLYIGNYSVKKIVTENVDLYRTSMRIVNNGVPIAMEYHWLQDNKKREVNEPGTRKVHYHLENYAGSVCVELNEQADIISFEEYYPFGGTALIWGDKSGVSLKECRYCGKELDSVTGLYYYGARYYSSAYGRMISSDGTEYIKSDDWQSTNLYAYCKNNPIRYTDLDGHAPQNPLYIVVGAVGAIGLVLVAVSYMLLKKPAKPIKDDSHWDAKNCYRFLKKNTTYITGEHEYVYRTDSMGRIISAKADNLKFKTHRRRLSHNPNSLDKKPGDHAGHLIADRFGGSQRLDNIVSQRETTDARFAEYERKWAEAVEDKKKVSVEITIEYPDKPGPGASFRPKSFKIRDKISHASKEVRTTKILTN